MISVDTNILLYALNSQAAEHAVALGLVEALSARDDVVICELVLVELYVLLRSPAVFGRPLSAQDAAGVCQTYREQPRWGLLEAAPVMDKVWGDAAAAGFGRRRIFDARLARTLRYHGVDELITRNTRHFEGFGFARLVDPFSAD